MSYFKPLVNIFLLLSCSCSIVKGPEIAFDENERDALFSLSYSPNADNRIETDGFFLPYDEACSRYTRGLGFKLFDDGGMSEVYFRLDYINVDSSIQEDSNLFITMNYDTMRSGIYAIKQDTLIIDCYEIDDPWFSVYCHLDKRKFIIVDRYTLREIIPANDSHEAIRRRFCGDRIYRFIPSSFSPVKYEVRMRNIKWMWDNEEDWKQYKKERKAYTETSSNPHRGW